LTNETSTERLAGTVETYLTTPKNRLAPILDRLFTDDAVVHDEGRTHIGIDAVGAWTQGVAAAFSFTRTIIDVKLRANAVVVRARLEGNFPGSPVELHHHFTLADDKTGGKISALTICP